MAAVFGDRSGLAARFVGHLAGSGVERGLVGPREVPRMWERHVLNCAVVAELVPVGATVVDVGSGAGLPGLAMAIARPDVTVTLLEPLLRRVEWLDEVVADLELQRVEVLRGRAEEVAGTRLWDVATARAVAPLRALAGLCLPLVRPGGQLLALKGRSVAEELEESSAALRRGGARSWEIRQCGGSLLAEPTTVVAVTAGGAGAASAATRPRRSLGREVRRRKSRGEAGGR